MRLLEYGLLTTFCRAFAAFQLYVLLFCAAILRCASRESA